MTMIAPEYARCFVCGTESEYMTLLSTNAFGPTDLDTRPPEMERSTMDYWVHSCPVCGYAAYQVSDETGVSRDFLDSESYRTCDGFDFASELARNFYRQHLILLSDGRKEEAFDAFLHTAWACDDEEKRIAPAVREKAILLSYDLLASGETENGEVLSLIRADLMRRSGRGSDMLSLYKETRYSNDVMNRVLDYEKALARIRCRKCQTVADAEEYAEGVEKIGEKEMLEQLRIRMYGDRYLRRRDALYEEGMKKDRKDQSGRID